MTLRLRRGIFIEPKTALPSTGCGTSRWLTTQGWGSRDALVGRLMSRPRSPGQPWGTAPAPARNAPGRREYRPRARRSRLLALSRAARRRSSVSTPPDSTSEAPRSRHGAAQAPRHEGRRVPRDPSLGGDPGGGHAPRSRQQPHGTGLAVQVRFVLPIVPPCLGPPSPAAMARRGRGCVT